MSMRLSTKTLAANATSEVVYEYVPERKVKSLRIINRGSQAADIGFASTITTGYGIPLAINAEVTFVDLDQDVYAIHATAASSKLVMVEEYYGED